MKIEITASNGVKIYTVGGLDDISVQRVQENVSSDELDLTIRLPSGFLLIPCKLKRECYFRFIKEPADAA